MRNTPLPDKSHLRRVDLLQGLSDSELDEIYTHLQSRVFRKGDTILSSDHRSKAVFFIHSGFVKISDDTEIARGSDKASAFTFNILGPNTVLGEMHALDSKGHSANVIALTPTTCLMLETAHFHACLQQIPGLMHYLYCHLTNLIRRQSQRYKIMMCQNLYGKLAWLLLDLSHRYGEPQKDGTLLIPFPLTNILLVEPGSNLRKNVVD